MPRPRVRPEERQRSERACAACKASKIRCDSQIPCEACVRRKRSQYCVYTHFDRRRHRHRQENRLQSIPPPGSTSSAESNASHGRTVDSHSPAAFASSRRHVNDATLLSEQVQQSPVNQACKPANTARVAGGEY